jgi:hypothetical protein
MKLCDRHLKEIKVKLWKKGVQPLHFDQAALREKAGGTLDVLGRVTQLLYSAIAHQYPLSVLNAPNDLCPACASKVIRDEWMDKAVHNVVWHYKAGTLGQKDDLTLGSQQVDPSHRQEGPEDSSPPIRPLE